MIKYIIEVYIILIQVLIQMEKYKTKEELYKVFGEKYGVKRLTIIRRLKKLNIEIQKDDEGVWLEKEDHHKMDNYNSHLANDGKLNNFGSIAVAETQKPEEIYFNRNSTPHQIAQLMRSSQQKATGILLAEAALTKQYLANPDLLDEDLLEALTEAQRAIIPPPPEPEAYAAQLLKHSDSPLK